MKLLWKCLGMAGFAMALAFTAQPGAQTEDVFAFIPPGGRTLLTDVMQHGVAAAEARSLLSGRHDRDGWLAWLQQHSATLSGLKGLGEHELATLSGYLAFALPLPADRIPADPAAADWTSILPADGRDLALNYCQSCHIITVVVTQDRMREHWLGTLNKPSHVEIKLTPAQRGELADYLVVNGGIPIDDVPEELRAGGASY